MADVRGDTPLDPPSVRGTWGRYAPSFAAEGASAEVRESIRALVELTAPAPGALAMDVATGAGYTAFAFARAGCPTVALDPTHEMLLATRAGWDERGLDGRSKTVEAWAEALPFRDGAFDVVVSHRAPHQFRDREAFLREARRVLRPDGTFGLADQSPPDGWEDWHNALERLRDPTHDRALSPREWTALVSAAGFGEVRHVVVPQPHDVEDWLDRVDCPPDRRAGCLEMLETAPLEVRAAYAIERVDGRLVMRTPQCVLAARG